MSMRRCQTKPLVSFNVIFRHTITVGVITTNTELAFNISLLCRLSEPFDCFDGIFGNPSPLRIAKSKHILCIGYFFLGSFAIPSRSLNFVLFNYGSVPIATAKLIFCLSITFFRLGFDFVEAILIYFTRLSRQLNFGCKQ